MQGGLRASGITVTFAGVDVVKDVDIELRFGEVHAITGENGAGKSSLAKAIAGVYRPRTGTIELGGKNLKLANPREGLAEGIALIHQEPHTFPDLDVAENIFAGHLPAKGPLVDWGAGYRQAKDLLDRLHAGLNPKSGVGGLSVAQQQRVELASALSHDAKVWIFDETTAPLTPKEVAELFEIMRALRDHGCALVIVTHRLHEIFEIADRITVLRDGKKVAERTTAETNVDEVIRLMVGRDLEGRIEGTIRPGNVVLETKNLSGPGFEDISLSVREGEIVGLAGLVGAGRTELARVLFGVEQPTGGSIQLNGGGARVDSPRKAKALGIALVPEDRRQDGLLLPQAISFNATLPALSGLSKSGVLQPKAEREATQDYAERLGLVRRSLDQAVVELSGGNQQKVVLSKWLMTNPKLLILDEPTRGVDVGAKAEVHRQIRKLADEGLAVLMISSDLPEVLSLSDRILVMREGSIAAEFDAKEASEEKIMTAAAGTGAKAAERSRSSRKVQVPPILFPAALVVLVVIAISVKEPRFLQARNLDSILLWMPLIAIAAMGQLMVILTRGIDISIGSILGFSGIATGLAMNKYPQMPLPLIFLTGLGAGMGLGLVNGLVVVYGRLSPLIVTIGTLAAFRGATFMLSKGDQIDNSMIPDALTDLAKNGIVIGNVTVSWLLALSLVVAAGTAFFLRYSRAGRNLFVYGSNPDAAHLRGISANRINLGVYVVSGALAGIAGVMYAARYGFVNPESAGKSFELTVIAAVAIGGAKLTGGSGSVLGVLIGCLLLSMINVGLSVMGIDANWQMLTYGVVILVAILIDGLTRNRRAA